MSVQVPTDDEINAAAVKLGIDVGGKCPRDKRAKVAKAIQLAADTEVFAEERAASTDAAVSEIAAFHDKLGDRVGPDAAARITAALAPTLYRVATARKELRPHDNYGNG